MDDPHVLGVELSILQGGPDRDGPFTVDGNMESIVNRIGRSRRDLVVVEGGEDVVGIATGDAITLAIDDERIDEMGPGVDTAIIVHLTALADDLVTAGDHDIHPDLIRIRRPLREQMPHLHGSDDGLEQILLAGLEYGSVGLSGPRSSPSISPPSSIRRGRAHHTLEELLMLGNGLLGTLHVDHHRHGRVGRREHVVMNLGNTRIIPNWAPKSVEGINGMWQSLQLTSATGG